MRLSCDKFHVQSITQGIINSAPMLRLRSTGDPTDQHSASILRENSLSKLGIFLYIYTYKQNNCIYRLLCLHFQHSVNWKLYTCQINDSKQKFRNKSLCISLCETNGCILHKYRSRKCRRQRPFLRTQYRT